MEQGQNYGGSEGGGGLPWLDQLTQALNEADRLCGRIAMIDSDGEAAMALRSHIRPISAELEALRFPGDAGITPFRMKCGRARWGRSRVFSSICR